MGFFGGRVDGIMNKFSEILYSLPYMLVVILLLVVLEPSLTTIIIALTITGWISMSWIVRGEIMQLKNRDFILAARSMGASAGSSIVPSFVAQCNRTDYCNIDVVYSKCNLCRSVPELPWIWCSAPRSSLGSMINDALTGGHYSRGGCVPGRLMSSYNACI